MYMPGLSDQVLYSRLRLLFIYCPRIYNHSLDNCSIVCLTATKI